MYLYIGATYIHIKLTMNIQICTHVQVNKSCGNCQMIQEAEL